MDGLKYKVISSNKQYKNYYKKLNELKGLKKKKNEIDLLKVLIQKYESENIFSKMNPVQVLLCLMEQNEMKAHDVADKINVSRGVISDILHYRKGFSKDLIRTLAELFGVNQEVFNRPYDFRELTPMNEGKSPCLEKRA